jgi:Arc/MetJ-type ribon-helix-helix transcriptional regulator
MKKKVVIFKVPEKLIKDVESWIKKGYYSNKTEALADAIRHHNEYINNFVNKVKKK